MTRRLVAVSNELGRGALRQPGTKRIRPLGWAAAGEDSVYAAPSKVAVFLAVWLALVQASCDWDSRGANAMQPLWCPHLKSSHSELCAVLPRHLGRKQPLESALICRNMKASYLSSIPFMENAWMKVAVGAGWRQRINNDITWRGVCQHSDTSFRLPLSDYPSSSPPMTGMITGRREEHNCQA